MRKLPSAILVIFILFIGYFGYAQKIVEGRVFDVESKKPLSGVRITVKNTLKIAYTDNIGFYRIIMPEKANALVFTIIGYAKQEVSISGTERVEVGLRSFTSKDIENVITIGSRNLNRTKNESPYVVDVISSEQLESNLGRGQLTDILSYLLPTFKSNIQSGSDASDHVEPFTIRGLAPDQVLVLINGKRYHPSSLLNVYGSTGRGANVTDINSIPISAIDRIEILRDGAAAQYGSDAIGGVINIVLKTTGSGLNVNIMTRKSYSGWGATLNYGDYGKVLNPVSDGLLSSLNINYGLKLGKGSLNITANLANKEQEIRLNNDSIFPDKSYRIFSDASFNNKSVFYNLQMPFKKSTFYSFGGFNYRKTFSNLWTITEAQPDRFVQGFYKSFFDPQLTLKNYDFTSTFGFKTVFNKWNIDVSNTGGYNHVDYFTTNTLNASLERASAKSFFNGEHYFYQNSTNIDFSKKIENFLGGLNWAMGAEYRFEKYYIKAGEEASWRNYSPIIHLKKDGTRDTVYKAGGSQGFPGFAVQDVTNPNRQSIGFYTEAELDLTSKFLISTAIRFENYSDFGSTLGLKMASRYKLSPYLLLRGSIQTGFRAPSLAQLYFNKTLLDVSSSGENFDKIFASNNSQLAELIGIPQLKAEKSAGGSIGCHYNTTNGFNFSLDYYWLRVNGRIVQTGRFSQEETTIGGILKKKNAQYAQFLYNLMNTQSQGLDISFAYSTLIGKHKLTFGVTSNFNDMILKGVNIPNALKGKEPYVLSEFETQYLLNNGNKNKIIGWLGYEYKKLRLNLTLTRFSGITFYNYNSIPNYSPEADRLKAEGKKEEWLKIVSNIYLPRVTSDLSMVYNFNKKFNITIGGNNIFDVYPTIQDPSLTESGGMWEAVQMGFSGANFYCRLNYKF